MTNPECMSIMDIVSEAESLGQEMARLDMRSKEITRRLDTLLIAAKKKADDTAQRLAGETEAKR